MVIIGYWVVVVGQDVDWVELGVVAGEQRHNPPRPLPPLLFESFHLLLFPVSKFKWFSGCGLNFNGVYS